MKLFHKYFYISFLFLCLIYFDPISRLNSSPLTQNKLYLSLVSPLKKNKVSPKGSSKSITANSVSSSTINNFSNSLINEEPSSSTISTSKESNTDHLPHNIDTYSSDIQITDENINNHNQDPTLKNKKINQIHNAYDNSLSEETQMSHFKNIQNSEEANKNLKDNEDEGIKTISDPIYFESNNLNQKIKVHKNGRSIPLPTKNKRLFNSSLLQYQNSDQYMESTFTKRPLFRLIYASILSNSLPTAETILKHTYMPNSLAILYTQILSEIHSHKSQLKSFFAHISYQLIFFIRNSFKGYILALALFIPFPTKFENLTKVQINDPYLLSYHHLPENATPFSFGLEYNEVDIPSACNENITLKGWLIKSKNKNSKKAIVCVHGLFSNRQSSLPFLSLAQKIGLLKYYNILMVDLRNGGSSESSESDVGMLHGDNDIYSAINFLVNSQKISSISFYGEGLGCASITQFLYNFNEQISKLGVNIHRLIFDSPQLDAKQAINTLIKSQNIHFNNDMSNESNVSSNTYSDEAKHILDTYPIKWISNLSIHLSKHKWNNKIEYILKSDLLNRFSSICLLIQKTKSGQTNYWKSQISKFNKNLPMESYIYEDETDNPLLINSNPEIRKLISQHFSLFRLPKFVRLLTLSKYLKPINKDDLKGD